MWGPSGHPYSPERPQGGPGCRMGPLCPSERKRRRNHTNTLQELAMLLPIPLQASNKKLTKEILLHVLHYIEHLQRSIDVAKSLLLFQPTNKEERRAEAKDPHPCLALGRGPSQPEKLPVDDSIPSRNRGEVMGEVTVPRRHLIPCQHLEPWLPQSHGEAGLTLLEMAEGSVHICLASWFLAPIPDPVPPRSTRNLQFWCSQDSGILAGKGGLSPTGGRFFFPASVCKGSRAKCSPSLSPPAPACCEGPSAQEDGACLTCEAQMTTGGEWMSPHPWSEPLPRQELVFYDSCEEEEEEETVDTGPWLSAWLPEGSPQGSPLVDSPRTRSWPGVGQPSEELGLSPSLFTSPGRLLPGKNLQEGAESLTQALFEDVCLSPQSPSSSSSLSSEAPQNKDPSAPGGPLHALNLCQSAFSLDHCYLSLSETSKTDSSPSSGVTELVSLWSRQQELGEEAEERPGRQLPQETQGDQEGALPLPAEEEMRQRLHHVLSPQPQAVHSSLPRHSVHSSHQGARAPVAGDDQAGEAAILVRGAGKLSLREGLPTTRDHRVLGSPRCGAGIRAPQFQSKPPACPSLPSIKARKFSRQHNRIVRQDCSSEDDDRSSPKPFHLLLAEKALCSPGLACTGSPCGEPLLEAPSPPPSLPLL
ncbi:meiosis initiator protein isoform X2 [Monodelphis domestica]|uniref:meiosis initiator protein isoform X2 n=1 Tax=Monodelphis domestica TaxID=13616 RepID=UPI0024E26318|nr:meiosis initiator protein isoform X2 [Monodelphis domestica]